MTAGYDWAPVAERARDWGLELDDRARARLECYLDSVAQANAKVNLTAASGKDELLRRHAADGLAAVPVLRRLLAKARPRLADLGAGAGFLGFSIKAAWPDADVTLIESLQRKYDFLNAAAARWALPGLRVVRLEVGRKEPPPYARDFDAVLARAVAAPAAALDLALPLLKPGGLFVDYLSDEAAASDPQIAKVLAESGARLVESHRYRLPGETRERALAVFAAAGGD